MNWKIIVGSILLFGVISEFLRVVSEYRSGKLGFWPFGVEIGAAIFGGLGVFLIVKGYREKRIKSRR